MVEGYCLLCSSLITLGMWMNFFDWKCFYTTLSFIVSPVYGTLLYGTLNGKNNNLLYDRIHKHSGLRNSKKFFTENRQRINALPREIFGWLPKSIRRHWWSVNLQISSNFPNVMAKQWCMLYYSLPKKCDTSVDLWVPAQPADYDLGSQHINLPVLVVIGREG